MPAGKEKGEVLPGGAPQTAAGELLAVRPGRRVLISMTAASLFLIGFPTVLRALGGDAPGFPRMLAAASMPLGCAMLAAWLRMWLWPFPVLEFRRAGLIIRPLLYVPIALPYDALEWIGFDVVTHRLFRARSLCFVAQIRPDYFCGAPLHVRAACLMRKRSVILDTSLLPQSEIPEIVRISSLLNERHGGLPFNGTG